MLFARAYAVTAAIFFAFHSSVTALRVPSPKFHPEVEARTPTATTKSPELVARKSSKRPKLTKRPRKRPHPPHKHPNDCSNVDLIKNGDFNKNVKGWEFLQGTRSAFFWVKDSKKRPAHSGNGQAYIFINRGYGEFFLTTTIPAIEYGNSITVSAWLRYEAPADVSGCSIIFTDNFDNSIYITLKPEWTKYSFESAGTGRSREIQFRVSCMSSPTPITVYLDDVSANACVPRRPNPECQVLDRAENFLVNPGFECPDGIGAWQSSSYTGDGETSLVQTSGKQGNPTHSGNGMAALQLDASRPGSGIAIYQYDVDDDVSRQYVKASFWLSVDSKLNKVAGCLLNFGTATGYYIRDADISNLTSKWTKFEVKNIDPTPRDYLEFGIYGCSSSTAPLFYLDDVYFGIDKDSPSAPPVPTPTPEPTPPPAPCTAKPTLVDPSFELGDTSNWLFFDDSPNYDTSFLTDDAATYGRPHAGSGVGVLTFPTNSGRVTLLQQVFDLCNGQVYTVTAWFYIPTGYDAGLCTLSIGLFSVSDPVKASASGVWTKIEHVFLASLDSSSIYPYIYLNVGCQNTKEMVVLLDDISWGPPPACSITATISDGSFESGDLSLWSPGLTEGDETVAITSARSRTGKKSLIATFPSVNNGFYIFREFDTCVGDKLTFRFWYYLPKEYKNIPCFTYAYAYVTGENVSDDITTYDAWVETKLDFTAASKLQHIDFGIGCSNQLKRVVVYMDDVSLTKR